MIATEGIRAQIMQGQTHLMRNQMLTDAKKSGMCTLEESLARLVVANMLEEDIALAQSTQPMEVRKYINTFMTASAVV